MIDGIKQRVAHMKEFTGAAQCYEEGYGQEGQPSPNIPSSSHRPASCGDGSPKGRKRNIHNHSHHSSFDAYNTWWEDGSVAGCSTQSHHLDECCRTKS